MLLADDGFEADELEPETLPQAHHRKILDLSVIELTKERSLNTVDVLIIFADGTRY